MSYNTGNPIGSADPRDLYDNAQVIDDYANSEQPTTTDRLGVERATISGIDAAARDAIAKAGYEFVGDYAPGIELTAYNQVVRDTQGEFWRVSGSTELPYTTTGAGLPEGGAFVTVGDAALRQELADPGLGGDLVRVTTSTGAQTVAEALDHRGTVFDNVADVQAAVNLTVGTKVRTLGYYEPGDGGGNDYEIVAGGTGTDDGGSFIDLSGSGLQAKGLFLDRISVRQFGARGDNVDDTGAFAAAASFVFSQAEDANNNRSPVIHCPLGKYRILSPIPNKATWELSPGAVITGLPAVPPSYERDLSYLTGSVIRYSGIDQFDTLQVGDNSLTVQKYTAKADIGEISGRSDNAAAGVSGSTYTSATDVFNEGCIGILGTSLNDNQNVEKGAWSLYLEAHRAPGAQGNSFCTEATTFNRNSAVDDTPNRPVGPGLGLTYNQWITTGGSPLDFPDCSDTTAAIGILGKGGARYIRGIIVKRDSVTTGEALALPAGYSLAWYGGTALPDTSEQKSATISGNCANPNGNSQVAIRVNEGTDGLVRGIVVVNNSLSPIADNLMSLGDPGAIYTNVYAQNTVIQTSDKRVKQDIEPLSETEKRVAQSLKPLIRKFRFKEAVEGKGDDARTHIGFMAQDIEQAFRDEGLDPFKYGMLCYDEWEEQPEIRDEDTGEVTQEYKAAGNRYGVRMDQLLAFIVCNT